MHLLYVDESGTPNDPNQHHFVFAGISVFERQTYWLSKELDGIAARFNQSDPNAVELHGSPMFSGKGMWRSIPKEDRIKAIKDCLTLVVNSDKTNKVFGCVVKKSVITPDDPVEHTFEQISSRFDHYLSRKHRQNDTQRGIIIMDKSTVESTIQNLATDFRTIGHSWGVLRNLSEVPLFLDSKASRMIQLADLIAYAMFRHYERGDDQFYKIIYPRFDYVGGTIHGLYERV